MLLSWILLSGSTILLIVLSIIVRNLLIKVERYEDVVLDQSAYIQGVSEAIAKSRERLKEIDERGTFESDDEVGWFFTNLKELQELLNAFDIQGIYGKKEK